MKLTCSHCTKSYIATKEQIKLIKESKIKGMSFIMIKCQNCWKSYGYNPLSDLDGSATNTEKISNQFLCPKETCSGLISYVDLDTDEPFWGCGQCGSIWFNKSDLDTDIQYIINKYPYRAVMYIISENQYLPSPNRDVPNAYEDMVKQEWSEL